MEKNTSRPFQVILGIVAVSHVMRGMLRGVLRFARDARDWVLVATQPGLLETLPPGTAFDGAIVQGRDSLRRLGKVLRGRKAVELNLDAGSVARLAARHFLDRGFVHYAFVGHDRSPSWSTDRLAAFRRELAPHGFECADCPAAPAGRGGDLAFRLRALADWLAGQPRPLAVFAAFDARAREVLDACRVAGLDVPGDVAVLGVDDDPLVCETVIPTLSSVAMDGEEAGYEAAAALDAAMRGRPDAGRRQRIVFGGVRRGAGLDRAVRRTRSARREGAGGRRGADSGASARRGAGEGAGRLAPDARTALPGGDGRPRRGGDPARTPRPRAEPAADHGASVRGDRRRVRHLRREPPGAPLPAEVRRLADILPRAVSAAATDRTNGIPLRPLCGVKCCQCAIVANAQLPMTNERRTGHWELAIGYWIFSHWQHFPDAPLREGGGA